MTTPNTADPRPEGWRADLATSVATVIRQCLDVGYDPARIAAELGERDLLAGEPCYISCACGPRTVPWPSEPITVVCETCGHKHAIAPLMDNYRSAIGHEDKTFRALRGMRDQLAKIRDVLDTERGEPLAALIDIRAIVNRPTDPASRVQKGVEQIAAALHTTSADVVDQMREVIASATAPTVYFPGDVVPAHTDVQAEGGTVMDWKQDYTVEWFWGPMVARPFPRGVDNWRAVVASAKQRRAEAAQ